MATRFPKFSQVLSEDPTTRRIWYSIATAHDLESHDDVSEEGLYTGRHSRGILEGRALRACENSSKYYKKNIGLFL